MEEEAGKRERTAESSSDRDRGIRVKTLEKIFKPEKNCYKVATAGRASLIIDGEAYFRAVYESFRRARHTIFVVGWDLHSDLRLVRDDKTHDYPVRLGAFLDRVAAEREGLDIYLVSWDFAMIYAMERELFSRYKLNSQTHDRIHFRLDGNHPVGASQHQKIVVVDDAVAFVGGFDLSKWRWDTSDHHLEDDRRIDPAGKHYQPFHDIQMAVDGQAAKVLGDLAREAWARAGGEPPVAHAKKNDGMQTDETTDGDPWPLNLKPDFRGVPVAIARTLPAFREQQSVREVERLYMDSIGAAKRWIYIENQYLSSHRIGQALKKRLQEAGGPEVVMVLPEKTGGWLEQHTMDVLRGRILRELREADAYDRLRVYYARIAKDPHCALMVHSKMMVIDDDFVRVGSSNLSNRSMGLDSECDLAIAAGRDEAVRKAIGRFRSRLIAEHLGCGTDDIAAAVAQSGSLIRTIEANIEGERTLVPFSGEVPSEVDRWIPESALLDPEKPVEPDELVDHVISPDHQPSAYRHLLKIVFLIAGVLVLAALWKWSPAKDWINLASLKTAAEWLRRQPLSPVLVMGTYVVGGVVAFPVTLMIIATVIVFGPWLGLLYALAGSELSAVVVFSAGRLLGRDAVQRLAGSFLNRLSHKLSKAGLLAVITFRIIPVAPFSVINLIAGVSEVRFRDFALGTFIGMLPGVIAIVLLADRISVSLSMPDIGNFTVLGVVVVLIGAALVGVRRWMKQKHAERMPPAPEQN